MPEPRKPARAAGSATSPSLRSDNARPGPSRPLPRWASALIQSGMVAVFVLLAFLAIYRFNSKLAIASLAASAFIAFGFPAAESARTRYMFGGYGCGVVCGAACNLVSNHLLPEHFSGNIYATIGFCAVSVFLTAFSMMLLDLEHPPANALAVSMVLEPNPLTMGLAMLACVLLLCLLRRLVQKTISRRLRH